jgi:hypothetical protein
VTTPSAYLDNCISPSGVVRGQLPSVEAAAFGDLERLWADGKVELYTSHVVKEEIDKAPAYQRQELENVYELYANVPEIEEQFRMPKLLSSQRSGLTNGPIVRDELLGRLLAILDETDARHVYQAARNGLDYFVTRDHETILRHAEKVHAAAGIKAVLPSQLTAELAARELSSE